MERLKREISLLNKTISEKDRQLRDFHDVIEENEYKAKQVKYDSDSLKAFLPYLQSFLAKFPLKDPSTVVREVENINQGASLLLDRISSMETKLMIEVRANSELKETMTETNKNQTAKITELTRNYASLQEDYEERIRIMKEKIQEMQNYKRENIDLHNCLFSLYNRIAEYANLETKFKPFIKAVEKEDFKVNFLKNEEITSFLKHSMCLASKEKTTEFHRELLAYCNVILRKHLKNVNVSKFEPIDILKELYRLTNEWSQANKEAVIQARRHKLEMDDMKVVVRQEKVDRKRVENQLERLRTKFNRRIEEKTGTINRSVKIHKRRLRISRFCFELEGKKFVTTTRPETGARFRRNLTTLNRVSRETKELFKGQDRNDIKNMVNHTNILLSTRARQREFSARTGFRLKRGFKG